MRVNWPKANKLDIIQQAEFENIVIQKYKRKVTSDSSMKSAPAIKAQ